MNTYFCTSTSLNPELQLVIFSLSLKLICSPPLAVNTETMVPSQHANTQGKTYQQKGKVLLKGCQLYKALRPIVLMGEEEVGGFDQTGSLPRRQLSGHSRWHNGK